MVNAFAIVQLISGILFGTLGLVSLINSMIVMAMCAILGMAIADFTISYLEKTHKEKSTTSLTIQTLTIQR